MEGDTVKRACAAEGYRWRGKLVPFGIDNSAFQQSLDKGRSKAPRLNDVLRGTFVMQIQDGYILAPFWISSEDNFLADHLSRDREADFLALVGDHLVDGAVPTPRPDLGRVVTFADRDYHEAARALRVLADREASLRLPVAAAALASHDTSAGMSNPNMAPSPFAQERRGFFVDNFSDVESLPDSLPDLVDDSDGVEDYLSDSSSSEEVIPGTPIDGTPDMELPGNLSYLLSRVQGVSSNPHPTPRECVPDCDADFARLSAGRWPAYSCTMQHAYERKTVVQDDGSVVDLASVQSSCWELPTFVHLAWNLLSLFALMVRAFLLLLGAVFMHLNWLAVFLLLLPSTRGMPDRGQGVAGDAQILSISYSRASVFDGLPADLASRMDAIMDNRLRPSSMDKVHTAMNRWRAFCETRGWNPLLMTDFSERGGRLAAWILSMLDETALVYKSIVTYVWGVRTWQTLQHQADPVYGVLHWKQFMMSIAVLTSVVGEPRIEVPFEIVDSILADIHSNHWDSFEDVQFGLMVLVLLFTFSRAECPCPKNFTGPHSFDQEKHWVAGDFKLRRYNAVWVLYVRFKGFKQDPRMERPSARIPDPSLPFDAGEHGDSKDWVPIGDVSTPLHFSISKFYMQHVRLLARVRHDDEPMFLARDQTRPYTYGALSSDFKAHVDRAGGRPDHMPHGLRVLGYNLSLFAVGEDLTVAHGGWSAASDGHSRYHRWKHGEVCNLSASMLGVSGQFADPTSQRVISRARLPHARSGDPAHEDPDEDDDSQGDDDEVGDVTNTVRAAQGRATRPDAGLLLPEGFELIQRVTSTGRRYKVYKAPDGHILDSKPKAWDYSHHLSTERLRALAGAESDSGLSAQEDEAPPDVAEVARALETLPPSHSSPSVLTRAERIERRGLVLTSPEQRARLESGRLPRRNASKCGRISDDKCFMCVLPDGHLCDHVFDTPNPLRA